MADEPKAENDEQVKWTDLEVIFDADKEVAAIVRMDTRQGWGPSMVGEQAKIILEAFVEGMPFDITLFSSQAASNAFDSWFQQVYGKAVEAASEPDTGAVDQSAGGGVAQKTTAGVEHGAPSDEPPAPGPADADMEANASQTDTVTGIGPSDPPAPLADVPTEESLAPEAQLDNCMLCNANGMGSNDPNCPVCGGSGKVPAK